VPREKTMWELTEWPRALFIVVSDDPISTLEYEQSRRKWREHSPEIEISRVEAITSKTIEKGDSVTPLNFSRKQPNGFSKVWRDFSLTEIAIWYSHANLWKKSISDNKPYIIVENDVALVKPIRYNWLLKHEMHCFGYFASTDMRPAAATAYYITPYAARWLLGSLPNPIQINVDGWIHKVCDNIGEYTYAARHYSRGHQNDDTHPYQWIEDQFRKLPDL